MTRPRSPRLRTRAGVTLALLGIVLAAGCGAHGDDGTDPAHANTSLSAPAPGSAGSPSPSPSPPSPCPVAAAADTAEVTAALNGGVRLEQARTVSTVRSDQDGSGWPSVFLAARLSGAPGSPVGLWAIADPQTPAKVLALNSAAQRYTRSQASVPTATRSRLAVNPKAANAVRCV